MCIVFIFPSCYVIYQTKRQVPDYVSSVASFPRSQLGSIALLDSTYKLIIPK